MSKLYTKSGDDGLTSLSNGKRVKKTSDMIEFYGLLDELNVFLALGAEALCHNQDFNYLLKKIYRIQKEIFELGSFCISGKRFTIPTPTQNIRLLEDEIDSMGEKLPVLDSFILPGGGEAATRIHLARVVCRKVEIQAFKLAEKNRSMDVVGIYLNRLSDWLYTAARTAAFLANNEEILI